MLIKDTAICLRKVDYSDTSQIVTLMARENGKFSAMAKGAKRKNTAFDGPIELLSYGDIVYSDKTSGELMTLTEFGQKPLFIKLRTNLNALNCSLFAAELMEKFTTDFDPHLELFDAFIAYLHDLQNSNDDSNLYRLLIVFQINLLKEIGLQPIFAACANCGIELNAQWREFYFSSSANGMLCPGCEAGFPDKIRISNQAAVCLANLQKLSHCKHSVLKDIERTLIFHFTELLHKPPKMAHHFL